MLELDLFLVPFFDQCFNTLNQNEQEVFLTMLNESDPTLLSWFMGNDVPQDEELAIVVDKIRQFRLKGGSHILI